MRKRIIALIACGLLVGCGAQQAVQPPEVILTAVEVATARFGDIYATSAFSGQTKADSQATIIPKIAGKIIKVNKEIGDTVSAGEVLAVIDGTDILHQVRQIDAQMAQTSAGIKVSEGSVAIAEQNIQVSEAGKAAAQANLSRTQGSSEQSLAQAQAAVDTAQTGVDSAQSAVDAAYSAISAANKGLENAQLNYDTADTNYNNNLILFNAGAVPQQTLTSLENTRSAAKIALDNAQRSVEDAQRNYEDAQRRVVDAQKRVEEAKNSYEIAKNTVLPGTEAAAAAQLEQSAAQRNQVATQREQALSQVEQAKAGLQALQAQKDALNSRLADLNVTSPISGVISEKNINLGEMAGAAPIYVVTNLSGVSVEVNVTERVIGAIAPGNKAWVTIKALNDEQFEGVVEFVSPNVGATRSGYLVRVRLDNSANSIKGGMFANVEFITDSRQSVLTIPISAIVNEESRNYVFTCVDNVVSKVEVELGLKDNDNIEVLGGLNDSDMIVVKGQQFLEDQQTVNVVAVDSNPTTSNE